MSVLIEKMANIASIDQNQVHKRTCESSVTAGTSSETELLSKSTELPSVIL